MRDGETQEAIDLLFRLEPGIDPNARVWYEYDRRLDRSEGYRTANQWLLAAVDHLVWS